MQLELRCGHVIDWHEGMTPLCPVHGEQGVARTIGAPAPKFRGVCSGPHATSVDLPAFTGRIIGSEAKES